MVGFGAISRGLITTASAVGMDVRVASEHAAAGDVAAAGGTLVPLDDLLGAADVVAIMTSLTDRTRGLIDAAAIANAWEHDLTPVSVH